LTIRSGPRVKRLRFDQLESALAELEARGSELAESSPAPAVSAKIRRFEPKEQVAARLELAGPERVLPKVHLGVDIHGDGSTEAYTGRVRRRALDRRGNEDAYEALRRAASAAELS
jgi:hypothetical protein